MNRNRDIKDITPFLSTDKTKESLSYVKVHKKKGKTLAVATDSFRLAVVRIPDFCDWVKEGYYTSKQWKLLMKDKDVGEIKQDIEYPDYEKILTADDKMIPVDMESLGVNTKYLMDMARLMNINSSFKDNIYFKLISMDDKKTRLIHKSDDMYVVLMLLANK